jgi:hypothetical protein
MPATTLEKGKQDIINKKRPAIYGGPFIFFN